MNMATNSLCKLFQRLHLPSRGFAAPAYSTAVSQQNHSTNNFEFVPPSTQVENSIFEPQLRLSSLSSGTNSFDLNLPTHRGWLNTIIDTPITINRNIIDPRTNHQPKEDISPEKSINLPTDPNRVEKQAARLIVIRRRKMRKHKLRKLRKKMKYIWAKRRQKREMRKEKAFHAELLAKIREAEKFDAEVYVQSRLQILDNVRIPNKWRGEILPETMIRKFMKEKQDRHLKRQSIPRLSL